MRELHGITLNGSKSDFANLKRQMLLFDKIHLLELYMGYQYEGQIGDEIAFLQSKELLFNPPADNPIRHSLEQIVVVQKDGEDLRYSDIIREQTMEDREREYSKSTGAENFQIRLYSSKIARSGSEELVTLFKGQFEARTQEPAKFKDVLSIALKTFPVPDSETAWDDIVEFKAAMADKIWALRRFLQTLSNKKQSDAEISDDIEWSLNEYTKAMKLHKLKTGNSFVEVYVIPAVEVLEDLAKLNWSKIAKGALSVKKRQVELIEAEMKAPGREVAYIYDAHRRFI